MMKPARNTATAVVALVVFVLLQIHGAASAQCKSIRTAASTGDIQVMMMGVRVRGGSW